MCLLQRRAPNPPPIFRGQPPCQNNSVRCSRNFWNFTVVLAIGGGWHVTQAPPFFLSFALQRPSCAPRYRDCCLLLPPKAGEQRHLREMPIPKLWQQARVIAGRCRTLLPLAHRDYTTAGPSLIRQFAGAKTIAHSLTYRALRAPIFQ